MRGENNNDIYCAASQSPPQVHLATKCSLASWHHKLGHPSNKVLQSIFSNSVALSSMSFSNFHCTSCSVNKSHKLPFSNNSLKSTKPLELVYTDVWGPTQRSIDGFFYYLIFVDFFTKYIWLYPMKKKSDVSIIFPQFKKLVETYFQTSLISIFSNNGGEYQKLIPVFNHCGVSHFTTPPHTPEHNGTAERRHRHVVETGLALLHFSGLPLSYWSHAFQTAVYLINRLPTPILNNNTPFKMLFKQLPNYAKLKPFGCLCYPWLKPYSASKLHPKSKPCLFLGYSTSQSAYKCLDPTTNRIYLSRHVKFEEEIFPLQTRNKNHEFTNLTREVCGGSSKQENVTSPLPVTNLPTSYLPTPTISTHTQDTNTDSIPQNEEPSPTIEVASPPHTLPSSPPSSSSHQNPSPTSSSSHHPTTNRPTRSRKPNPKYYNPKFLNLTTNHPIPTTLVPSTVTQAQKDPLWRKAMDSEFNALLQNGTWELIPKANHAPIGCKWIFRIKRKADGSIERYKARLVAKGYLQQPGKEYFETLVP